MPEIILQIHRTTGNEEVCAGQIILVERTPHELHLHPFVTWWENTESNTRHMGNYFKTIEEAKQDFDDRTRKY